MTARRNRVIAFVVAGVLVLAVAFGGTILSVGRSQSPSAAATAPAGGSATTLPINQTTPSGNRSFNNAVEPGDGVENGGFQTKKITVPSHAVTTPTTGKVTVGSTNGG